MSGTTASTDRRNTLPQRELTFDESRRRIADASKSKRELGWAPTYVFEDALAKTVTWYLEHRPWAERVMSGAYRQYFDSQYKARLHS